MKHGAYHNEEANSLDFYIKGKLVMSIGSPEEQKDHTPEYTPFYSFTTDKDVKWLT